MPNWDHINGTLSGLMHIIPFVVRLIIMLFGFNVNIILVHSIDLYVSSFHISFLILSVSDVGCVFGILAFSLCFMRKYFVKCVFRGMKILIV